MSILLFFPCAQANDLTKTGFTCSPQYFLIDSLVRSTSPVKRSRWYRAEDHEQSLGRFMRDMGDCVRRKYHCLDMFSYSGRVKEAFEDAGFKALQFDVKISNDHDVVSQGGFKELLRMGMSHFV